MLTSQFVRNSTCISFVLLMAAGCGTTPSKVIMPYGKPPPETGVVLKADSDRYNNRRNEHIEPSPYVLPFEVTRSGALAQMEAHIEVWSEQERVLSHLNDNLGNGMFGGAIISAGGALLSSLDIAKVGAVIAGGGAVWGDHYKLTVQAENYRFGVQAMNCARLAVASIPKSFWDNTFENGEMKISRTNLIARASQTSPEAELSVKDSLDILEGLFGTIHSSVQEIRRRLTSAQISLKIAAANASDIKLALTNASQAETVNKAGFKNVTEAANFTKSSNDSVDINKATANLALVSEQSMRRALNLPSELKTCTTYIGG